MIKYFLLFLMAVPCAMGLDLAVDGKTEYVIIGNSSDPALKDLQKYLKAMSGADFKFGGELQEKAIIVTDKPVSGFAPAKLSNQGYQLKVAGKSLVIYSPGNAPDAILKKGKISPLGLQFGVYGLLDEVFGCRFLAKNAEYIPVHGTLSVPDSLDIVREPSYRNRFFTTEPSCSSFDLTWAMKNRLGFDRTGTAIHGNYRYLPPEKYFKEHPEWYPMSREGKRAPKDDWFCWSNPEVAKELTVVLREKLKAQPKDHNLQMGQGDNSVDCLCPECRKINEEHGSPNAACLLALNRVAEKLMPEFPEHRITTFAYHNTAAAPQKINISPFIVITYVNTGDHMKVFTNSAKRAGDFKQWTNAAKEIVIYDWSVNFGNMLLPFPNIKARAEDIRLFHDQSPAVVVGFAPQVMGGGDFIELREWLFARMMWDTSTDIDAAERDFLKCYYGEAAGAELWKYLDHFQKLAEQDPGSYNAIFGAQPGVLTKTLYTKENIAFAESCFSAAHDKADTAEHKERLEKTYITGFAYLQFEPPVKLDFCKLPDGSRAVLPGGKPEFADKTAGIHQRICKNEARISELGGPGWQAGTFTNTAGAKLDGTASNEHIEMAFASAMDNSLISLADKKSGRELLALGPVKNGLASGIRHMVGMRGGIVSPGKMEGSTFFAPGIAGTNIWWTPEALIIDRRYILAPEKRGFKFESELKVNPKAKWAFSALKGAPYFYILGEKRYAPSILFRFRSNDPLKTRIFIPENGGRYASIMDKSTLEIKAKSFYIIDSEPLHPVIRIDLSEQWNGMNFMIEDGTILVKRTAPEIEAVEGQGTASGSFDLEILDRADADRILPPEKVTASITADGKINLAWSGSKDDCDVVMAESPAGPWTTVDPENVTASKNRMFFRVQKKNGLPVLYSAVSVSPDLASSGLIIVASDGTGDASNLESAIGMLPKENWKNDWKITISKSGIPYTGAVLPKELVPVMGKYRLIISGEAELNGSINCNRAAIELDGLTFVNRGAQANTVAVMLPGPFSAIRNCKFTNYGNAIRDDSYRKHNGMIIENNVFSGNSIGFLGIAFGGTEKEPFIIRGNLFENGGSLHYIGTQYTQIENNTFRDSPVRIDHSPTLKVTGNTFSGLKTTIEFLNRENKAGTMVFTDNTFDREQSIFSIGKERWNLNQVNEYFAPGKNKLQ